MACQHSGGKSETTVESGGSNAGETPRYTCRASQTIDSSAVEPLTALLKDADAHVQSEPCNSEESDRNENLQ